MAITEVTWAAAQRLSTQWPFILTALLVFAGAWALQTFLRPDALSKIPLVSSDIGDESKRRAEFLSNAKAVYEKGYSAFKNGAFRITAARGQESFVFIHSQTCESGGLLNISLHCLSLTSR